MLVHDGVVSPELRQIQAEMQVDRLLSQKSFVCTLPHEVVLDTNILVAAFRSNLGASHQIVRSIGLGRWRPNISVALALEYEDVLKRRHLLPNVSMAEIDRF
jgi:PIN domain